MKRLLAMVAMAAGCAQAAPPLVSESRLEVKSTGTGSSFWYDAKTTKAEGGRVDLQLYYVRRYITPPGLRLPSEWIHIAGVFVRNPGGQRPGIVEPAEPPFSEELVEVDRDAAVSRGGNLREEMGASDLPPWPGLYRVVATWPDPDAPGDDGMARDQADLEVGSSKDLAAMRAKVDREVYEDLARIGKVLYALRDRWARLGDAADTTWADYRKEAARKLDAVKQRNGSRHKAELYWMEYQGKKRIDLMMQKLEPALDKAGLYVTKAKSDRPKYEEMDLALAEVEENYQYYLNFLGFGRIVDDAKIDGALADMKSIAAELKDWSAKAAQDQKGWQAASLDIQTRLMQATVDLTGEFPDVFFARADAVSKCTTRMLEAVRGVASGKTAPVDWAALEAALETASKELREAVPRIDD